MITGSTIRLRPCVKHSPNQQPSLSIKDEEWADKIYPCVDWKIFRQKAPRSPFILTGDLIGGDE